MTTTVDQGSATATDQPNVLLKLWRNKETRSVIIQIVTIALLFAFFAYIIHNAVLNLEKLGKTFSFGFLWEPSNYDINQTLIPYTSHSTHFRAMLVGILNTLLVSVCGVILATILGFLMGVIRLSSNWLASRMVYVFIELARNVPVLLQILLIYGIIIHVLPIPKKAISLAHSFFLTNRGIYIPKPISQDGFMYTVIAFFVAIVATYLFRRWAKKVQEETGKIYPVFWIGLGVIVGLTLIVFFATGAPLHWELPKLGRFNLNGGLVLAPEFTALWLALSLYTAAFIAEIVRAGIMAINKGQWEAAGALGLRRNRALSLVIIPQALRIIIPPLASQYLNLTKNSSLAIAIGYMDIVATIGGISLMQTGKEMETMIIVLGLYLIISLTISGFMNWYNQRIKLVER